MAEAADKNELHVINGRYRALRRWHPENINAIEDAQRDRVIAKIERYVKNVVDEAPPLRQEQRDRLAALIQKVRPSGGDAA